MARQARRIGVDIEADVEQRKKIIYKAAAALFAENGVQHTSVADIAKKLNVAKPSVYHYISSKEELIDEVLRTANKQVEDLIQEAESSGPSGIDRLRFILREIARNANDPFGQCLARIEANTLGAEQGAIQREAQRNLQLRVANIIKSGIDDGSIRPCNPTVQSFLALGAAMNVGRWYRAGGSQPLSIIADQMVETVTYGIGA